MGKPEAKCDRYRSALNCPWERPQGAWQGYCRPGHARNMPESGSPTSVASVVDAVVTAGGEDVAVEADLASEPSVEATLSLRLFCFLVL